MFKKPSPRAGAASALIDELDSAEVAGSEFAPKPPVEPEMPLEEPVMEEAPSEGAELSPEDVEALKEIVAKLG